MGTKISVTDEYSGNYYTVWWSCVEGMLAGDWAVQKSSLMKGMCEEPNSHFFCKCLLSSLLVLPSRSPGTWGSHEGWTYRSYPPLGHPFLPQGLLPNHSSLGVTFQQFSVTFLNSLATQGLPPLHLGVTWGYFSL